MSLTQETSLFDLRPYIRPDVIEREQIEAAFFHVHLACNTEKGKMQGSFIFLDVFAPDGSQLLDLFDQSAGITDDLVGLKFSRSTSNGHATFQCDESIKIPYFNRHTNKENLSWQIIAVTGKELLRLLNWLAVNSCSLTASDAGTALSEKWDNYRDGETTFTSTDLKQPASNS